MSFRSRSAKAATRPRLFRVGVGVIGLGFGCAGAGAGAGAPGAAPATTAKDTRQSSAPKPTAPEADAASAAAPASKAAQGEAPGDAGAAEPAAPRVAFPPPNFSPPHERSAQAGDGEWVRLGDAGKRERAAEGPAVFYKTVVHPHKVSRFLSVTVVAIDLDRVQVRYVPGKGDAKAERFPADHAPGLVPSQDQAAVLAVFNGGFKPSHGHWGMLAQGQQVVPPRETGCTVALYKDESVRIGSWSKLSGSRDAMRAYRQTPPCLMEDGALHPQLARNYEKPWGGNVPNIKTRRRSAIGIDESGQILFYGLGEEVGPRLLAEGMHAAGANTSAELDINWYWTRFLLFANPKSGNAPEISSTLVPNMEHQPGLYITRPSDRDFFYVTRR